MNNGLSIWQSLERIMQTLWENKRARVIKLEGRLQNATIHRTEPDDLDYEYYSLFLPRQDWRGTIYGNPGSLETYDTFYGAVIYDQLTLASESGATHVLPDVIVIKKFQPYIKINHFITLYCITDAAGRESNLVFALKSSSVQKNDLDGIGSMTERVMSSLKRQLTLIAVPSILSILLFSMLALSMLAGIIGSAVYVCAAIIFIFLGISLAGGFFLLKMNLHMFPSRNILADILSSDGFRLAEFQRQRSI